MITSRASTLTAIGVGVFGAMLKVIYSFLPLFNVLDVVVFGMFGAALGRGAGRASIPRALWMSAPAMLLCAYFLARLGPANVAAGVGTGWLLSLFLIPAASCAGAYFARADRRVPGAA